MKLQWTFVVVAFLVVCGFAVVTADVAQAIASSDVSWKAVDSQAGLMSCGGCKSDSGDKEKKDGCCKDKKSECSKDKESKGDGCKKDDDTKKDDNTKKDDGANKKDDGSGAAG